MTLTVSMQSKRVHFLHGLSVHWILAEKVRTRPYPVFPTERGIGRKMGRLAIKTLAQTRYYWPNILVNYISYVGFKYLFDSFRGEIQIIFGKDASIQSQYSINTPSLD